MPQSRINLFQAISLSLILSLSLSLLLSLTLISLSLLADPGVQPHARGRGGWVQLLRFLRRQRHVHVQHVLGEAFAQIWSEIRQHRLSARPYIRYLQLGYEGYVGYGRFAHSSHT